MPSRCLQLPRKTQELALDSLPSVRVSNLRVRLLNAVSHVLTQQAAG